MLSKHPPTNPVPYQGKLTIANAITDVTRLAGVQGDGAAYPDSSVGVWPAATNLCTNGGGETNTTGWAIEAAKYNNISSSAGAAKFGSKSILASGVGSANNNFQNINFTYANAPIGTYTASAWFLAKNQTCPAAAIRLTNSTDGATTSSPTSVGTGTWVKITVTKTTTSVENLVLRLYSNFAATSTGASGEIDMYFDGIQLETGSIATPYIETDGGTASRSAGLVTIPNSIIDETQMWVALRAKMGWSQAAESTLTTASFLWNCRDSANEGLLYYYDRPSDSMVLRRDSGGVGTNNAKNATGLWAQGDDTSFCAQITASGLSQSIAGSVFTAATANATIPTLSTPFYIGTDFTAGREPMAAFRWVAIGKGILTDADAALFHAWGNNDPLPHMFPPSARLSFLAHFNGDGTFYRRSA